MVSKQILVIQTAFIGDVILATSVLETLHRRHPDFTIDLLVRKGNEALFREHPYLGEVLVWDKKQGKYRNWIKLLRKIRQNRYDYVINLHRFAATGLFTALSDAKVKIGFDKNPFSFLFTHRYNHRFEKGIHEIDRNYQLLGTFTDAPLQKPALYPTGSDYQFVSQFQGRPYYCIAPASVRFTKQFPKEQWARLIGLLPPDCTIYILGGPGDFELGEYLSQDNDEEQVVNLCGKLSLLQSAALMKGAVMNYVNDSAPMHLCSALDAPVCAIYCSTVPELGYGPLSPRSFVIQTQKQLSCRPCGNHGHHSCPEGHFSCAMDIDVRRLVRLSEP